MHTKRLLKKTSRKSLPTRVLKKPPEYSSPVRFRGAIQANASPEHFSGKIPDDTFRALLSPALKVGKKFCKRFDYNLQSDMFPAEKKRKV